jgi:hypothetical protein
VSSEASVSELDVVLLELQSLDSELCKGVFGSPASGSLPPIPPTTPQGFDRTFDAAITVVPLLEL